MTIFYFAIGSITCPSSRYRIYNYISLFEQAGIRCRTSHFWGELYFNKLIHTRNRFGTRCILAFYYPVCIARRFLSIFRSLFYDIICVERDFCPGLPPAGEYIVKKLFGKKVVFQFDDAVYLSSRPKGKTEKVMRMVDGVIAGNRFLGKFASAYNSNIAIIPTAIDIRQYHPPECTTAEAKTSVTIGWIGTFSTLVYLDIVKDVLEKLSADYNIELNVICNHELTWDNRVKINNIKWNLATYIDELCRCDIGIMPLLDNEWEHGKCGFKILQYMGAGIPVVASQVGANKDIVRNGDNGLLAGTSEEWFDALALLIRDRQLGKRMGHAGRATVEKEFSVQACAPTLIRFFEETLAQ